MKVGDRVAITKVTADSDYFSVGDVATLIRRDSGGDWWANFDGNITVLSDGIWCLQESAGTTFKLADEASITAWGLKHKGTGKVRPTVFNTRDEARYYKTEAEKVVKLICTEA